MATTKVNKYRYYLETHDSILNVFALISCPA